MNRLRLWLRGWMFQFSALRGVLKRHGSPYTIRQAWLMGRLGRWIIYGQLYGKRAPMLGIWERAGLVERQR